MNSYMMSKKIMEINPSHSIIKALKERHTKDENDSTLKDLVILLYESSLINSGFSLDDPSTFVNRINRMIKLGLSLDDDDESDEYEEIPPLENTNDDDNENSKMEEVD